MNSVFMLELDKFVVVFINDILIYSKDERTMLNIWTLFHNASEIISYMLSSPNVNSGWIV
jgi:hypothetical protein